MGIFTGYELGKGAVTTNILSGLTAAQVDEKIAIEASFRSGSDGRIGTRITTRNTADDAIHAAIRAEIAAIVVPTAADGLTQQEVDARIKQFLEGFADTETPTSTIPIIRIGDNVITLSKLSPELQAIINANTEKRSYGEDDERKLSRIADNADVSVPSDWDATTGVTEILNKPNIPVAYTATQTKEKYESNADTNAFTDNEKTKLGGIAADAEENVQSSWSVSDPRSPAYIIDKPESINGGTSTPVPSATTEVEGKAELATEAEADTGTDNTRIMTPLLTKGVVDDAVAAEADMRIIADSALGQRIVAATNANDATHISIRQEIADLTAPTAPSSGLTQAQVKAVVKALLTPFSDTETPLSTIPLGRFGDDIITLAKLSPTLRALIDANTAKIGITGAQARAIAANSAKVNTFVNSISISGQTLTLGRNNLADLTVDIPGGRLTESQAQTLVHVWALANNFTLIPPSKLPNATATERGVVLISTQDLFDSGADAVTIADTNYTVAPRMSLLKAALDSKIGKTVHALLNTPGLVAAGTDNVITAGTNSLTIDDVNLSLYVKPSQMKSALDAKIGITTEQADAIIANSEKVGISLGEAAAIVANTAKISFNADASTKLARIESQATADQTSSEIISLIESATGDARLDATNLRNLPTGGGDALTQAQLDAIAANTAKIGITPDQAAAIVLNTAKTAGGDVFSPAASVDNAIVIFNGTTGKTIINSLSTIDDDGGYHATVNGSGSKKAFEMLQAGLGVENQLQWTMGIANAQHQQAEINFRRGNTAVNNAVSFGVWGAAMWVYTNGRVSIGPQIDASQVERFFVNGTTKLDGNTEIVGNIVVSGTVAGRDVAADGVVLDTLEAGGTSYVLPNATELIRGGAIKANDSNISTGTDIRLVGTLTTTAFVVPSQLKSEIEKRQIKLTAGTNISITDEGSISASGLSGGSATGLTGLPEERPGGNANFVYQKVIPATNGQVDITPGDTYPLGHGSKGYAIQYTDSRSGLRRLTASGTLGHPIPGLYGFFISGGHILECYLNPTFLPDRNQTKIQARFTEVRSDGTTGARTIVMTKSQGQSNNDIASFFTNIIANFNLDTFSYFKNVQIWYDPNAINGSAYTRALFPATVASESTKVSDLSDLRAALGVQNSGESLKNLTETTPDNRSEFVFHESIPAHDAGFSFSVGLNPIGNNSVGYGRESSGTINRRDAFLTYNAGSVSLDIPFLLGIGYDGDTGKIEVVTTSDIDFTSIKLRIKFPGRVQQELILFKKGIVAGITRNSIRYSTPDGGATYRLWKIGETYSDVNILYDTDDSELVTTQPAKEVTKSSSLEHLGDALSEGNVSVVDSIDNITPDHTKFFLSRKDNRLYRYEYDHGNRVALHAGVVKTGAFGVSVGATNVRNIAYTKGGTLGVTTTGTGGGSKFIAIYSGVPGQSTTLPVSSVVRVKHDTDILGEIIVNGVEHRLFRITHDADPAVAGFNSWTADLYDEYTTYGDPLALSIRSLDRDIGIKYADGTTFFGNDESTSLVAFDVNDTDGKSVFTQQDRIHLSGLGRGVLPYEIQALADNLTITADTTSILDMIPKQISPGTFGFRQNLGYETKEPANFYTEAGAKIFGKHVVTIQTNQLGVLEIETLGLKLNKVSIGVPGAANVEFTLRKDRLNRKNSFLHVNTNVYTAESYNIPFVVDSLVKVGLIDENGRAVVFDSTGAASILLDSNIKARYDSLIGAPPVPVRHKSTQGHDLPASSQYREEHGLGAAPGNFWATITLEPNSIIPGLVPGEHYRLVDESSGTTRGYNVYATETHVGIRCAESIRIKNANGELVNIEGQALFNRIDVTLYAEL